MLEGFVGTVARGLFVVFTEYGEWNTRKITQSE